MNPAAPDQPPRATPPWRTGVPDHDTDPMGWCKARALIELDVGSPEEAYASLVHDVGLHPDTNTDAVWAWLGRMGPSAMAGGYHVMKRFICGIASKDGISDPRT